MPAIRVLFAAILSVFSFYSASVLALSEEKLLAFEIEGVSMGMAVDAARAALVAKGYQDGAKKARGERGKSKIGRASNNGLNGSIYYTKREDRKKHSVNMTYYKGQMTKMSITLPRDESRLDSEIGRLKSHFGEEAGQCDPEKMFVCTLRGQSATSQLMLVLKARGRALTYALTSKYSSRLVQENKNRERVLESRQQALGKHPCLSSFDPQNLDEVYGCLASLRVESGMGRGTSVLGKSMGSCGQARYALASYLKKNGIMTPLEFRDFSDGKSEKKARKYGLLREIGVMTAVEPTDFSGEKSEQVARKYRIPDCAMMANVAREVNGKLPNWGKCIAYQDDAQHLKQCLRHFVPAYYGGKNAIKTHASTCEGIQRAYRIGVKAGNPVRGGMPEGFRDPDCKLAISALHGEGGNVPAHLAACANYEPMRAQEHVDACLGDSRYLAQIRNCNDVRQLYERNLVAANGVLPSNYVVMRCSHADGLLIKAEQRRAEMMARMREEQARKAAIRRKQAEASNKYWNQVMKQGEQMLDSINVATGPLVKSAALPPVHASVSVVSATGKPVDQVVHADTSSDLFAQFEQAGIIKALYHERYDLLNSGRRDIIIYLATFGAVLGGESVANNYPQCRPYFNATIIRSMQDEIINSTGVGKVLSGNIQQSGEAALGMSLGMLRELMTNGYGKLYQSARNVDLLKEQAQNDAFRFAGSVACESEISQTFRENAIRFIQRRTK